MTAVYVKTPSQIADAYWPVSVTLADFSGADPTGVNDSTAAVQDAIDQIDATGQSGTLWVPQGTYLIGAAIQTTNAANGQVTLPSWGQPGTHSPVIRIKGTGIPQQQWVHYGSGQQFATTAQSTFKCGLSSGNGAIFGVGGPSGSLNGQPPQGNWFSGACAVFEDLQFVTGTALGALNMALAWGLQVRNCIITPVNTGSYSFPLPTTTTQAAITTPYQWNNQNNFGLISTTLIQGVYTGVQLSEHMHIDHLMCAECHDGLLLLRSQHVATFSNYCSQHNFNGISFGPHDTTGPSGNLTRLWGTMSFERDSSGPYSTGYVISDPNNDWAGQVWYAANLASPLAGFAMNGGSHITATSLG